MGLTYEPTTIGGSDHLFPTCDPPAAMDLAVRIIALYWPRCVYHCEGIDGTLTRFSQLRFPRRGEIIVYRDAEAEQEWERVGCEPWLVGTMLYLLADDDSITVVSDDVPGEQATAILESIRYSLAGMPGQR